MEPEQIQSELFKAVDGPNGWQSLRHLMLKLKKESPSKVLDALLGVFFEASSSRNRYKDQEAAGGLLWKLKPKYERNLRDDVQRSFINWDVSIEELPWYLAEAAGFEKVRESVKSILAEPLDQESKKKAETYLYWLSPKEPQRFKGALDQSWNGRLRG